MKLATFLAGTAVASLAMFTDIGAPLGTSSIATAQAQASISFSVFYNGLADHGDWVRYQDEYVFIPARVERGWRPYTVGHWVYANDYGWTWASDEPFGWATYHYGRWGYAQDIGWYWVPGTRWAPAWVSWRRSKDHVVWAPLPPRLGSDVSIEISVGDIPDFYWVAVPTRSFLDVDLRIDIVKNDRDRRRIVERTEFIGTPRVQNNIIVNTVIDIDIIQKETGRKVRRVDVRKSDDPRQARATDEQVTVFEGEVRAEADAKPERVKKVEEVAKITREDTAEQTDAQQPTDQTAPDATDEANDAAKTKIKKNTPAQAEVNEDTGASTEDTATDKSDETPAKKKRKQTDQAETPATNTNAGENAGAQVDEPASGKKAKKAKDEAKVQDEAEQPQEQASQPQNNKKKNADDDIATGSTGKVKKAGDGNKAEKANKKNNKTDCDPSIDPGCAAQQ